MKHKAFLFILLVSKVVMAEYPEEIDVYIEWNFEMEASQDKAIFRNEIEKIRNDTKSEMPWYMRFFNAVISTDLEKSIGLEKVVVAYPYSTEEENGDWIDHEGKTPTET